MGMFIVMRLLYFIEKKSAYAVSLHVSVCICNEEGIPLEHGGTGISHWNEKKQTLTELGFEWSRDHKR